MIRRLVTAMLRPGRLSAYILPSNLVDGIWAACCMARMSVNKSIMAFSRGRRFDDLGGARSGIISIVLVVIVFLGSCRVSPLY